MLQMSAVQLKALLNAACKVADNMCIYFLGDYLNLYSESCLQCIYYAWITLRDFVLELP